MYTSDGHMCAAGMNPDRPVWDDVNKPTDAERLRAMEGFFGCCGRCKVDSANHVIYHYPEVALDPKFVGTVQKRPGAGRQFLAPRVHSRERCGLDFCGKRLLDSPFEETVGWRPPRDCAF
jgi:hypothetical protein